MDSIKTKAKKTNQNKANIKRVNAEFSQKQFETLLDVQLGMKCKNTNQFLRDIVEFVAGIYEKGDLKYVDNRLTIAK